MKHYFYLLFLLIKYEIIILLSIYTFYYKTNKLDLIHLSRFIFHKGGRELVNC